MSDRNFAAVEAAHAQSKAADKQQVLLEMIRAIAAGDAQTMQKHLAEDVQVEIHGFAGLEGYYHGREAVLHAVLSNLDKVTQQIPKIEELIEQCDSVAMLLHKTGIFKATNKKYEVRGIMWYTFDELRLKWIEEFVRPIEERLI